MRRWFVLVLRTLKKQGDATVGGVELPFLVRPGIQGLSSPLVLVCLAGERLRPASWVTPQCGDCGVRLVLSHLTELLVLPIYSPRTTESGNLLRTVRI